MFCQFWSGSKLFAKIISRQMVIIHIRINVMLVLIWIQTVCKCYQQTNSLDPHQDQCSVSSDLDPNCLQRLSADKWFRSTSGSMLCRFWSRSKLFAKVVSRQMVSIHIRTNVLSVLIWIQTVCKGYQQTNGFDSHQESQDQCSVGSDLDPNCSQRLSADNKVSTRTLSELNMQMPCLF